MRRFITSAYVTLDGVVENPHLWPSLPGGSADEHDQTQTELLEASDLLVMGRRTYDVFAPAWTARGGDPYSDRINAMPKLVASTTLDRADWNNTEITADPIDRIRDAKDQDGGHILQYGFGTLTEQVLAAGLLDELHLWIHPQFVTASTDDLLFRPQVTATFDLVDTQTLSNGTIIARYRTLDPGA